MATKGTKRLTGLTLLSNCVVQIDDSSDSDEEANFAGITVPTEHKHDFRILTSNYNVSIRIKVPILSNELTAAGLWKQTRLSPV